MGEKNIELGVELRFLLTNELWHTKEKEEKKIASQNFVNRRPFWNFFSSICLP